MQAVALVVSFLPNKILKHVTIPMIARKIHWHGLLVAYVYRAVHLDKVPNRLYGTLTSCLVMNRVIHPLRLRKIFDEPRFGSTLAGKSGIQICRDVRLAVGGFQCKS